MYERRWLWDLLRYASRSLMENKSQPLQTVTAGGDQCKTVASNVVSYKWKYTLQCRFVFSGSLVLPQVQRIFNFSQGFLPSSPMLSRDRGMISRFWGCWESQRQNQETHLPVQRSYLCNAAQNAHVMNILIVPFLVLHFTRPLKYVFLDWITIW